MGSELPGLQHTECVPQEAAIDLRQLIQGCAIERIQTYESSPRSICMPVHLRCSYILSRLCDLSMHQTGTSAAGPAVLSHVHILKTCRILGARVSLAGVCQNGWRRVCAVGHTLQPGQVLFGLEQRQSSHHAVDYPLRLIVGVAILLPAHALAGLHMHTRYHKYGLIHKRIEAGHLVPVCCFDAQQSAP